MAPNILRDQFLASKAVVRKIVQQDTYIADPDFNEAGQISDHAIARVLHELAKRQSIRFGSDWAITGGSNQVTISNGIAAIDVKDDDVGDGMSYLFHLASNEVVSGFTTPSGSDRTDHIYLDMELATITAVEDPTLVIPDLGEESAVDIRLQFSMEKIEGSSVPSPPADHYYFDLATIERYDGQATINVGDITNHLAHYEPLESSGEVSLVGDLQVAAGKRIDGIDLNKEINILYSLGIGGQLGVAGGDIPDWDGDGGCLATPGDAAGTWHDKLRVGLFKKDNIKYVRCRCQVYNSNASWQGAARLQVNGYTGDEETVGGDTTWTIVDLAVDVSGASENEDIFVTFGLKSPGGSLSAWARKVMIYTTVE